MPAAMAEWALRRHRGTGPPRLDRAAVCQLYGAWDRLAPAGLPRFSAVIGALHNAAYDIDVAYPGVADRPALRERAVHARTWLIRYAPEQCWLLGEVTDPAGDDLVREALHAIRAGAEPAPGPADAAKHALFGVDTGPGLRTLRRAFDDETLVAALERYLRQRDRPLRAAALANLGVDRGPG
jgi:hypothetical protein